MSRGLALLLALSIPLMSGAADWRNKQQRKDEFLLQLKRDINKTDKSIAITKDLIARSKGEKYLPDLHFRLAELYVAKSRLLYFKVLEEAGLEDKRSVTAPEARLLKDQAIRTYRRILQEFPDYPDNDKIRFFVGHELRELGEFEAMIREYQLLVEQYPDSDFRWEAYLVLGDYYFDKADLDNAELYYKKIVNSPETYVHNLARYKLAWCHLNRERFKEALELFEKVILTEQIDVNKSLQIDAHGRMNVKREALVDSAFCYTEVKKPQDAVPYYRKLAQSRSDYIAALEKLARRYSIKGDPGAAATLYREAMAYSNDVEHNMDLALKIYEMVQQSKKRDETDKDVELMVAAAARYRFSWRGTEEQKKQALEDFELLTRDLSTKLQLEAQQKDDAKLHAKAARAYKAYLSLFKDSPNGKDMTWNYAEALFESGQYVEAGRVFEKLAQDAESASGPKQAAADKPADAKAAKPDEKKPAKAAPAVPPPPRKGAGAKKDDVVEIATKAGGGAPEDGERRKAMYSAVMAYFQALRKTQNLTRLEQTLAREGIKNLGVRFVEEYPKDEFAAQVKFNVARAYYEQGELKKANELFVAYAAEHPGSKDAVAAANLALDALQQQENYVELAKQARAFAKDTRLGDDKFRSDMTALASSADQQEIDRRTIEAQGNLKEALSDIIKEKKGTDLAAKALYQAFAVAKDRRDIQSMQSVGTEIITEYPDSTYAQGVLPALGELAINGGEYDRGAGYYEEFTRRFPNDKASTDLLSAATELRLALGDRANAMTNLEKLIKASEGPKRTEYQMQLIRTALEAKAWRRAADASEPLHDNPQVGAEARVLGAEGLIKAGEEAAAARVLLGATQMVARGEGGENGKQAASRASFMLGELLRKEYEQIKFGSGADDATVLAAKFQKLEELEKIYGQAVQLGDAGSAIAALYRVGQAYRGAADMLDGAPMPEGLAEADQQAYRAALAERSGPLRSTGDEYLKTCKEKSGQLRIFSPFARACLTGAPVPDELPGPAPRAVTEIPGAAELRVKLRNNPKDVEALVELGKRALAAGDYYGARVIFSRAEELAGNRADVHNGLGVANHGTGDVQAAYFSFKRALEIDSGFALAHHNLAIMFSEVGDTTNANAEKGAAGGAPPDSPEIIKPQGGGA
ncbi:MAG: tetratricopeptide repeat protein [Myxococcota bacterium]